MIRKLLVAPVLVVLAFLAFSNSPSSAQSAAQSTTSQAAFSFEFYNFQTNNYVTTFPFGHNNEVIVASKTQDVRNQLPISLSLKIAGNEKWSSTIANDPTQNCRDATGCSTRGPTISDPGADSYVELSAKGKDGQSLATYTSGTPPSSTTETANTTETASSKPQTSQTTTVSNPTNNWWHWWWLAGFWIGILWLFPWVFVGWQWARLKFWGFGWPWPWWFWIPLFWFIPWLIIGWWWWLDWWFWWVWLWWLFPWVFWLFWWLVVFKEAMIWLWHKSK